MKLEIGSLTCDWLSAALGTGEVKFVDDTLKSADGVWSVPKIAAAVAHASMAVAFIHITWTVGFLWDLWVIYGSIAVFHNIVDKAGNQITEFKHNQLDAQHPPQ